VAGIAPRDWLYAFMRHWLAALPDLERPDLYQCLPEDFNLGHRLPPGQHPLIRLKTEDCGRWLKARARHGTACN
jgi:hypothetical protein